MRLVLVSQEYPPETAKGGIGAQTHAKAHGLSALGHEVVVLSRAPDGLPSERMDGSVRVIRIAGMEKRMAVYTEVADWLTYSAEVCASIHAMNQEAPIDLVEFPEWAAEGYVHFSNQSVWNRIPSVVQIHGPLVMFCHAMKWPDPFSDFYRIGSAMEGFCLRKADAVYSSSAYSASWCERYHGLRAVDIPVIHSGVDTDFFQPTGEAKTTYPSVAFTGKLVRNKGAVLLVEAAIRLLDRLPGLRLVFMGRGEEPVIREMKQRVEAAGNPQLLEFKGFVPREQLPAELSRCHLFAVPAAFEGGPGLAYLEAMACGLPVIACAGNGVAEIVDPMSNGILVPPEDPAALADAMLLLLDDPVKRREMSEAARCYAVGKADRRACIRRIESFYLSTIHAIRSASA